MTLQMLTIDMKKENLKKIEFNIKNLGKYHNLYGQVIHYCLQKFLELSLLKYMNLFLLVAYLHLD